MTPIRFELSGSGTVTYGGHAVTRTRGSPIGALCRALLGGGQVTPGTLVECWRGPVMCFGAQSVERWAGLTVREEAGIEPHFAPYREPQFGQDEQSQ